MPELIKNIGLALLLLVGVVVLGNSVGNWKNIVVQVPKENLIASVNQAGIGSENWSEVDAYSAADRHAGYAHRAGEVISTVGSIAIDAVVNAVVTGNIPASRAADTLTGMHNALAAFDGFYDGMQNAVAEIEALAAQHPGSATIAAQLSSAKAELAVARSNIETLTEDYTAAMGIYNASLPQAVLDLEQRSAKLSAIGTPTVVSARSLGLPANLTEVYFAGWKEAFDNEEDGIVVSVEDFPDGAIFDGFDRYVGIGGVNAIGDPNPGDNPSAEGPGAGYSDNPGPSTGGYGEPGYGGGFGDGTGADPAGPDN